MPKIIEIIRLECNFVKDSGDFDIFILGKNKVTKIEHIRQGVYRIHFNEGEVLFRDIYHPKEVDWEERKVQL